MIRAMKRTDWRLLVFDWDGTVMDSAEVIVAALQQACRDVGIAAPSERDARYVIGLGLEDALRYLAPGLSAGRHAGLVQRYRHHFLRLDGTTGLFDGVADGLDALRSAGYVLAVATGKSRRGLDRALAATGLAGHFLATRCADEGRPKPFPDMLEWLMREARVGAAQTLMIGDTTHDLAMARSAGVAAVGVTYGAHECDALAAAGPLACFDRFTDVCDWLLSGP